MRKFWNWEASETDDTRTLYLDGVIAEDSWWGDEVTPKAFKDELHTGAGDITVWINSPGGDVFAAAQIYNMLKEYSDSVGSVTVKIDGLAASAASVIAMAGNRTLMSPVSMLMLHNPWTVAIGSGEEMLRAKAMLDEVKESIINAYELKSGLSRVKLSHMMDDETWFNAQKAVELGFADGIMYTSESEVKNYKPPAVMYSHMTAARALIGKISMKQSEQEPDQQQSANITKESLNKRLFLVKY